MNALISLLQILLHPGGKIIKQLVSKLHLHKNFINLLGELGRFKSNISIYLIRNPC